MRGSLQSKDDGEIYGIGDDFRPDGDPNEAFWGWYWWRMSDKKHMPTREEVRAQNYEWVSDVFLIETIAKWVTNTSSFFGMLRDLPNGGEIDVPILPMMPEKPPIPMG